MNIKVIELLARKQYKQRSVEWFSQRSNAVTASSASNLLIRDSKTCDSYIKEYNLEDTFDKNNKCCNPYSSKRNYILDKCNHTKFKGSIATFWGQKYEQVVTDIYSKKYSKNVSEFGLIIHKDLEWLGASPDGITDDGIMLEIKCPFRRKITGIPPFYYWIQVQIQLEVCDLEYCDFVECEFIEFISEEEFLDDEILTEKPINKGLFIKHEKIYSDKNILCKPEDMDYTYPDKELIDDIPNLFKWRDLKLKETHEDKNSSCVYWKTVVFSNVRIKRDREWFDNVKDTIKSEWDKIKFYKTNNNYRMLLFNTSKELEGNVLEVKNNCVL